MERGLSPVRQAWCAARAKVAACAEMVWRLGADDPRKVLHGLKVGLALAIVSLFYYLRPLYDGVGGAAMWAVMTVVVVFEFTVGGSLYKGLNRAAATLTGGGLAIGVHWAASKAGQTGELVILNGAVFILASLVTFSRFIPVIKTRFDYGATIFILTFSLVTVSGYRVDQLVNLAQQRLSTIAIGISICLIICTLICPVWAGTELHLLITSNMDKLADSLDCCVEDYFTGKEDRRTGDYKSVLNSKASEDSLGNLAVWEPAHGRFGFQFPWSQYQKIGAALRNCAYCMEALNATSHSQIQAPELLKKHLMDACMKLSSKSSEILKELSSSIKSMRSTSSSSSALMAKEIKEAVEEAKRALSSLPSNYQLSIEEDVEMLDRAKRQSLMESLPLVTFAALLMEISVKVDAVEKAVQELAELASFEPPAGDKN
ncbi:Aluminum-activated malate transporter 10 [Platanthera zijinensis]|uniref:Aluminum-activated malate transporter 10 n=1 Tax=Platanthera zijinensis TaxID=2320716 RepID=A0AAP0G8Q7_9ASPA